MSLDVELTTVTELDPCDRFIIWGPEIEAKMELKEGQGNGKSDIFKIFSKIIGDVSHNSLENLHTKWDDPEGIQCKERTIWYYPLPEGHPWQQLRVKQKKSGFEMQMKKRHQGAGNVDSSRNLVRDEGATKQKSFASWKEVIRFLNEHKNDFHLPYPGIREEDFVAADTEKRVTKFEARVGNRNGMSLTLELSAVKLITASTKQELQQLELEVVLPKKNPALGLGAQQVRTIAAFFAHKYGLQVSDLCKADFVLQNASVRA